MARIFVNLLMIFIMTVYARAQKRTLNITELENSLQEFINKSFHMWEARNQTFTKLVTSLPVLINNDDFGISKQELIEIVNKADIDYITVTSAAENLVVDPIKMHEYQELIAEDPGRRNKLIKTIDWIVLPAILEKFNITTSRLYLYSLRLQLPISWYCTKYISLKEKYLQLLLKLFMVDVENLLTSITIREIKFPSYPFMGIEREFESLLGSHRIRILKSIKRIQSTLLSSIGFSCFKPTEKPSECIRLMWELREFYNEYWFDI